MPFDPMGGKLTSGMRCGTPAVTTRGMKEPEMDQIGEMISRVIFGGEEAVAAVKEQTLALCARFPLYPELG